MIRLISCTLINVEPETFAVQNPDMVFRPEDLLGPIPLDRNDEVNLGFVGILLLDRGSVGGTTTINWRVVYDRADEDFDCPGGFRKHVPGLTPKEHREMLSEEFIRERADRQYAEMLAREDRRDAEVRGRHRWDIIAFGLLVAASTLIGSMISAGWFGRPW